MWIGTIGEVVNVLGQLRYQAGRFMNALQAGGRAFVGAYREDNQSLSNYAYGEWPVRMARYELFDLYAQNGVYSTLNRYAQLMRERHNLYKHIRGIYNPVHRLIALEAAKTYGGSIDWSGGLRTGAIPVEGADDNLIAAITQVLKWSNFGTQKTAYVRQGARFGDSFLKVIDDVSRSRVRMEVLDPRDVRECDFDAVGNITRIVIEYERVETTGPDKGKAYSYREIIEKTDTNVVHVSTYKGDALYAYFMDTAGEPIAEWDLPYDFVPVRHAPHVQGTSDWGATSFQGSLSKINELNDLVSITHDGVRKTVNPTWAVTGGRMPSAAMHDGTERDQIPVINLPTGGDIKPLVATLDLPGAMTAIDKLIGEIERDMPQLSLQRIRESGGDASGVSIENSYSDASSLLIETQGNYDQGLIAAIQMAITIAAVRKYAEVFSRYTLDSYARGELDFYLRPREVFTNRLTPEMRTRLILEAANNPAWKLVFRELGVSEEDIADIEIAKREQEERQTSAAIRGLAEGFNVNDDDEETEDEAEEVDNES